MSPESLKARTKRLSAQRARRLAEQLLGDDEKRVLAFADELDAQADELERQAALSVPPVVQHPQASPAQEASQETRPIEQPVKD